MPDAPAATGGERIGVVLVNWRGAADTAHCLASLRGARPRPACVVVVENASGDDSLDRLRAACATVAPDHAECAADAVTAPSSDAWLTLLPLSAHRGFAGGNNAALRLLRARGDLTHVLLLNNDTEVAPDFFAALHRALGERPDAALVGTTIYHFDDRARVWYAGGDEVPLRALVEHRTRRPASDAVVPTEFVTGCAMLISRATLDRIGDLPEVYFPAYGEDAEYSHRVRAAGLPVLYAPAAVVYHRIGASTRRSDLRLVPTFLTARHRAFFVRRNLRGGQRAAALAYLAITKPARAAVELLRGRPAVARAVIAGTIGGLFSPDARRDAARP